MWAIACKTLVADRGKLLTALVGVVFSIVLVNIQGGLFIGLVSKASVLVNQCGADIWVGHKKMNNVDFPQDVPRRWVQRIRSIEGVRRAESYVVGQSVMTLPDGGFEPVVVVGSEPYSLLGSASNGLDPSRLRRADSIVVDQGDKIKLGNPRLGDIREIGHRRARIVGFSNDILNFIVTPYVFTTIDRATRYLHKRPQDVSYFLIQLEDEADAQQVCNRIRARLPEAEAYTKNQYSTISIEYWLRRTGIGASFGAATALGLIVGLVIVGQTLYASVLDRLGEFGTLKAIGAQEWQIHAIILGQALILAIAGSLLGLYSVAVLQYFCSTPRATITIPWYIASGSCLLVTIICLCSSLLPYLRVRSIDPGMVLQN